MNTKTSLAQIILESQLAIAKAKAAATPVTAVPRTWVPPSPAIYADTMVKQIVELVSTFEAGLKPTEEIAMHLATFGGGLIRVTKLGYYNPHMVVITGTRIPTGEPCQIVQHMNQTSIMLVAVPAVQKPPVRIGKKIGFQVPDDGDKPANDDGKEDDKL